MDKQDINWRKASYSNGSGNCVEVAGTARVVLVRDTQIRDGGTLAFTTDAWRTFTRSLNVLSGGGSTAR